MKTNRYQTKRTTRLARRFLASVLLGAMASIPATLMADHDPDDECAHIVDVWDSSDPDNFVLVGQITTIQTAQSGKQHYNYFSASAHPIDVAVNRRHANLWVHESTTSGDLTFGFVFGADNSGTPFVTSLLNFRIVDSDTNPFVSQSDDPGEAVETPAGSDAFVGTFNYGNNTDGIAVSGISGNTWTIIVDSVDFGPIITDWFASNGESLTTRSDDLPLTLGSEYRLTPCGNPPSGKPVDATVPSIECPDSVVVCPNSGTVSVEVEELEGDDVALTWEIDGDQVSSVDLGDVTGGVIVELPVDLTDGLHVGVVTVSDKDGSSSCTVAIIVNGAPTISSDAPAEILPNETPVTVTLSVDDDFDTASLTGVSVECYKTNKNGKQIDKTEDCEIEIDGDQVTILDAGGVGTTIVITATAEDECSEISESFTIQVARPANEGVGNGVDGDTPGHDNNGGNDDPGTGPGNPGAKGKRNA